MSAIVLFILMAVYESNQQDPSLDTNAWLEKYDKYRKIIEENTEITNEDNLTPEIRLHLITPRSKLWNAKSRDSPFKDSPFFAFYWAGGQGLTRYILDHPEIVKGKRVLDLGSGCGATAIAAAKCGAKSVTANDIDPLHCLLTDMNARLNNVAINITNTDFVSDMKIGTSDDWDVVLVGDMFYENPLAEELTEWLRLEKEAGKFIYIGDPGRYLFIAAQHKPGNYLEFITRYKLVTCVSIDMNAKINNVNIKITKDNLIAKTRNFTEWDCVFFGDVFYEFDMMKTMVLMMRKSCAKGTKIFIGEPCGIFRAYTMTNELKQVAQYTLPEAAEEMLGYGTTFISEFCC
ncbi:electron transfer flavoprotein beta subunit lysine methyltransferase-like isoform X1 [Macrosteles quadrilineatus]|uniref:electron transfer flavoprotein beta subunit lysine methyltransferase-like isoform X1 n=1 Tax=Macrosteles quadrilineatus TaxID=74068 RepID=UPI0023E0CEEA|nr:electron transfer flavoprotein beta subunit lysine methyltransferase-like isoform X1 [Macrosteles quadrilineatus]